MAAGKKKLSQQKLSFFSCRVLCQCCAVVPAVVVAVIFGLSRLAPDDLPFEETLFSILTLDFPALLPDRIELWNSFYHQTRKHLHTFTENKNIQLCLIGYTSAVFLIITINLIKKLQVFLTRRKPKRGRPKKTPETGGGSVGVQTWYKTGAVSIMVLFVFSLGWEWVRMYQMEVAKKAATVHVGFPAECKADGLGAWTSIKSWLRWHLSWSHDPCQQYHQALLVDPFWEVNPLMVLTATVTRCVIRPVELISAGTGSSLRLLFQEIPSPWQPVVMATVILALVLSLTMACRYKIRFPLFFSLEPSNNTLAPTRPVTSANAIENTKDWTVLKPQQNGHNVQDGLYGNRLKLLEEFNTPKKGTGEERSPYAHLKGSPSRNGDYYNSPSRYGGYCNSPSRNGGYYNSPSRNGGYYNVKSLAATM